MIILSRITLIANKSGIHQIDSINSKKITEYIISYTLGWSWKNFKKSTNKKFHHISINQPFHMAAVNDVLSLFEGNRNTEYPTGIKIYFQSNKEIGRVPAQDFTYDFNIWYVSKLIYLSQEYDQFSLKSSNLFIDMIALIVRMFIVMYHNILYDKI